MSECVVRMEKPTSCDDCDIADRFGNEIYCPFLGWYADYDKCPVFLQLPEGHGRLVDAEKLKERSVHFCETEYTFDFDAVFVEEIDEAPTIVPAEAERSEK